MRAFGLAATMQVGLLRLKAQHAFRRADNASSMYGCTPIAPFLRRVYANGYNFDTPAIRHLTICRRASATICPPPRSASVDTIYVMYAYVYVTITVCPYWRVGSTNQSGLVTLTFDLESGVRVTCDVGYHCANFILPVLQLGSMYATNRRQTSDKSIA